MFCYKCGAQNPDDFKFCSTCGTLLSRASSTDSYQSYTAPNPAQPPPQTPRYTYNQNANARARRTSPGCIVAIVAGLVILFVGGMILDMPGKSSPTQANAAGKTSAAQPFGVGQTAVSDGVYITLVSAYESTGTQFSKPAGGNTFLFCEFTIENKSKVDINISSMLCFEAYFDNQSVTQSLTALVSTTKSQLDGAVASGKTMNGVIAYEIPANWRELEVRVDPHVYSFGSEPAIFIISR